MYKELGGNYLLTEKEIVSLGSSVEDVAEALSLPNPEYEKMVRFSKGRWYKTPPKTLSYLRKQDDGYIIPRYFFAIPQDKVGTMGREFGYKMKKSFRLRDYQEEFLSKFSGDIESNGGLLIEASCGSGKTVLGIYLAALKGRQSMVLVPTYYLARQWQQRIEEFSDYSCYIVKSSDKQVPVDYDFVIIAMDLLNCRNLPDDLLDNTGTVILDEAHRMGADSYLPIIDSCTAHNRIALTATFRRQDNVHKILAYHFGLHIKMENRFPRPLFYAVSTGVEIKAVLTKSKPYNNFLKFLEEIGHPYHETQKAIAFAPDKTLPQQLDELQDKKVFNKTQSKEILSCIKRSEDMPYTTLESYIGEHSGRRKVAISLVKKCLESDRTVLFLSKRKDILHTMKKVFSAYNPALIVSETNKRTPEEEQYLQNECHLILGVNQLAKEGLDIDRLDTLIIYLPMKDTEQAVGRISRLHPDKKQSIAFYLLDDCPLTYATFNSARKYININADLKGTVSLRQIDSILNK